MGRAFRIEGLAEAKMKLQCVYGGKQHLHLRVKNEAKVKGDKFGEVNGWSHVEIIL